MIISDSGAAAAINMAGGTVIMNDGTKITNHKRTSGYGPAVYMTGGNFKMKAAQFRVVKAEITVVLYI